jgi:acyl dehydratase
MEADGLRSVTVAALEGAVGGEAGLSPWIEVTQEMIDRFAEVTEDRNFIHVDPEAAARTPFGGTIAHGFLSLSLLSTLAYRALPPLEGRAMGINHGFDRVRFVAPVRSGARIRARFRLAEVRVRPSGYVQIAYDVTMEIEGDARPAFTARWLTIAVIDRGLARPDRETA